LVAGYVNACVDQNGGGYKLFTPPPDDTSPTALEPARIVRHAS
jgi:hypothetical protein